VPLPHGALKGFVASSALLKIYVSAYIASMGCIALCPAGTCILGGSGAITAWCVDVMACLLLCWGLLLSYALP
jgi:hypothetical protein